MPHLWEEELGVELVDGLDVGEDGGHRLGGEQSTRSILLVHAEVKNLEKKKWNVDEILLKDLKPRSCWFPKKEIFKFRRQTIIGNKKAELIFFNLKVFTNFAYWSKLASLFYLIYFKLKTWGKVFSFLKMFLLSSNSIVLQKSICLCFYA